MRLLSGVVIALLVAWTAVAQAAPPPGALYLDGGRSAVGIVLVPGRGQTADGFVVGPLRKSLNAQGYHTVSLQLPKTTAVETVSREAALAELKGIYPASRAMILAAVEFLRREHGARHIYLLSHSMGTTIAAAMLAQEGAYGLTGLVVISTGDYGEPPFNTTANLGRMPVPVLDIYGDQTGVSNALDAKLAADDARLAPSRSGYASATYRQVFLKGAGHAFVPRQHETALRQAIVGWIAEREAAAPR